MTTSSKQIISLHLEECIRQCPHRDICYHVNKNYIPNNIYDPNSIRKLYLDNPDCIIYESVCGFINPLHAALLKQFDNYNITTYWDNAIILIDTLGQTINLINRIQITINNEWQIEELPSYEKLYLVKDELSLRKYQTWIMNPDFNRIHFLFDQNYLKTDDSILRNILLSWNNRTNTNVSLDSCILNWVLNGECIFSKDYIDISYDGSLRKCPYNKDGITLSIEDKIYYNRMDSQCDKASCYYCARFKKD